MGNSNSYDVTQIDNRSSNKFHLKPRNIKLFSQQQSQDMLSSHYKRKDSNKSRTLTRDEEDVEKMMTRESQYLDPLVMTVVDVQQLETEGSSLASPTSSTSNSLELSNETYELFAPLQQSSDPMSTLVEAEEEEDEETTNYEKLNLESKSVEIFLMNELKRFNNSTLTDYFNLNSEKLVPLFDLSQQPRSVSEESSTTSRIENTIYASSLDNLSSSSDAPTTSTSTFVPIYEHQYHSF